MSVSVMVQCPSCQAQGNLADPALFGQPISCPACQQVFVAPFPADAAPAVVAEPIPPVTAVTEPGPTLPPEPTPAAPPAPLCAIPGLGSVSETRATDTEVLAAGSTASRSVPPTEVLSAAALLQQSVDSAGFIEPATAPPNPQPVVVATVAVVLPPGTVPGTPIQPVTFGVTPDVAQQVPSASPAFAVVESTVTTPSRLPAGPGEPPPGGVTFPEDGVIPDRTVLTIEGPLPEFLAPPPEPGHAEVSFAQSLPEPVARGNVQPPKMPSKQVQMIAIGAISVILLFATVMFLMGDPSRKFGKKPKPNGPVEDNPIARPFTPQPGDGNVEDIMARINAMSKPEGDKPKE